MPPKLFEQSSLPTPVDTDQYGSNGNDEAFSLRDIPGYNIDTGEIDPDLVIDWAVDRALEQTSEFYRLDRFEGDYHTAEIMQKKVEAVGSEYIRLFVSQRVRNKEDAAEAFKDLDTEKNNDILLNETIGELVSQGYFSSHRGDYLKKLIGNQLFAESDFDLFDAYFHENVVTVSDQTDPKSLVTFEQVARRVVSASERDLTSKFGSSSTPLTENGNRAQTLPDENEIVNVLNHLAEKYVKAEIRQHINLFINMNLYEHSADLAKLEALDELAFFREIMNAEGKRFQYKDISGRFALGQVNEWLLLQKDVTTLNEQRGVQISERQLNRTFYSISVDRNKLSSSAEADENGKISPLWQEVIRVYFPPDQQSSEVRSGIGSIFHLQILFDGPDELLDVLNRADSSAIKAILKKFGVERSEADSPTPSPSH